MVFLCGVCYILKYCWNLVYDVVLADMRKAMPRDVHKKSIIPLKRAVTPEELEYD